MNWDAVIQRLDLDAQGAWFVYLSGIVLMFLSIAFRKNISWREWIITFGMVGFVGWMANIVIFFQLDLLDSGDPSIGGLPDIVMFAVAPAALANLFLSYYEPEGKWKYAAIFTGISVLLEYALVKVGFLTLKGWNILYSIPFYLLMFGVFLPWLLNLMRGEEKVSR